MLPASLMLSKAPVFQTTKFREMVPFVLRLTALTYYVFWKTWGVRGEGTGVEKSKMSKISRGNFADRIPVTDLQ